MALDSPPRAFRVDTNLQDGVALLSLFGPLDMFAVGLLEKRIHTIELGARRVVLDLRGLTEIASSGVASILRAQRRSVLDGWALSVVRGSPTVTQVFRASPLARELVMVDSPDGLFPKPAGISLG